MRLALLTLADHAVAADDGRIHMIGGGIDRLAASAFPAIVPHLSLAVKFLMSQPERSQEHSVQVRLLGPAGKPIIAPMGLLMPAIATTSPSPSSTGTGDETPYQFVYNMRDVRLEVGGSYTFSVEFDNRELGPLSLFVEQSAIPSLSLRNQSDTLSMELGLGYQRFAAGDAAGAQSTFERLIQLFPRSPDAHNNYGFLLLSSGNPQGALTAFQKAAELGHTQMELLTANIACCNYLLGDFAIAFDEFKGLLRAALQSPQATLFGLGRSSMKPIFLFSQADYLALMALNAGRSSERIRQIEIARQFASMAEVGLVTFQLQARPVFASLLEELKKDLSMAPSTGATSR